MDGKELQQKRKKAGVTQLELAKYLGYTINGEPPQVTVQLWSTRFPFNK